MGFMKQLINESKRNIVKVPNEFQDWDSLVKWFRKQPIDAKFMGDIIDPETGEVIGDHGSTKKKLLKDRGKFLDAARSRISKDEYQELKVPDFYDGDDLRAFENFYNIAYSIVSKKIDHPEEMKKAGYDIDSKMPTIIKRKDNVKLTMADKVSIESYMDWYSDEKLPFDVSLGVFFKGNRAEFYPILGHN